MVRFVLRSVAILRVAIQHHTERTIDGEVCFEECRNSESGYPASHVSPMPCATRLRSVAISHSTMFCYQPPTNKSVTNLPGVLHSCDEPEQY
jgi:hypothetical protein